MRYIDGPTDPLEIYLLLCYSNIIILLLLRIRVRKDKKGTGCHWNVQVPVDNRMPRGHSRPAHAAWCDNAGCGSNGGCQNRCGAMTAVIMNAWDISFCPGRAPTRPGIFFAGHRSG